MFNVKNEVKQYKGTIDLLTNQIKQSRSKQFALSKEETKLKQKIMEKKENLYNLVRAPRVLFEVCKSVIQDFRYRVLNWKQYI